MNRPSVFQVVRLVDAYYRANAVGGNLHIVLDDGNLQDSHIAFSRSEAIADDDPAGVFIADLLLQMTMAERFYVVWGDRRG